MDNGLPAGTLPQRHAGTRVMVWPFCWRPSFGTPTGIPRTRGLGKCSSDEVSLLGSDQAQEDWGMDWELRVGLKGEKPTQQVTDFWLFLWVHLLCLFLCMCSCMLSHVRLFCDRLFVTYQAPLPMEFSRQEYGSGLPFPPPISLTCVN